MLTKLKQWLFDHQTGLAFTIIAPFFLAHVLMPAARPPTSKFFKLSYYNSTTGKYGAGHDDLFFVAMCIVFCIGIRAALMQHILAPLGKYCGISKKKDVTRFSEQGWMLAYYIMFWPFGMYLYCKSPYYLNLRELWTEWPQRELDGLMKGYILVQWAYWIQQVVVVNIETRRKDYWEMIVHHVITISLIAASYAYHQTRVAHLILVLMDVVELIFPLAKCLKCIGLTAVCDVLFGIFLLTWLWTRHVLYLVTCWSVYSDLPRMISSHTPCYRGRMADLEGPLLAPENSWSYLLEPFQDPAGMVCFTDGIRTGFLVFLLALELVICAWTFFIIRVFVRVLKGGSAEDVRSDEEEEEEVEYEEMEPLEEEVGVEGIDLTAWGHRTVKKESGSRLSGVGVSRNHSDRKALINRIGCEKQID